MRLVYRLSYVICMASGHVAAWLAADFKVLDEASESLGILVLPLQLPVLIVWCPARALSLMSFALCRALEPQP